MKLLLPLFSVVLLYSCSEPKKPNTGIEIYDTDIEEIIDVTASFEVIADSIALPEGPVWDDSNQRLLFVDCLNDQIMQWTEKKGASKFIAPGGNTGYAPNLGQGLLGPNGLVIDNEGNLLVCQHGDRRVAIIENTTTEKPSYQTLVDNYQGRRLNSPNDLVIGSDGSVYFTDPPFAFFDLSNFSFVATEMRELDFNGVYRYNRKKEDLTALSRDVSIPNGLGLSPDERFLYVNSMGAPFSQSTPKIMRIDLSDMSQSIFFDGEELSKKYNDGTDFDGMAIHSSGTIFTSGPGGLLVISPEGKLQARLNFGQITNCTFDAKENYLYVTGFVTNPKVFRLKLKS